MKKLIIKSGIAATVLGLITAALVYKFVINKPHPDYEKAKASFTLLAADPFESYRADRTVAEASFNGKMVQLNGRIDRIEQNDSLLVGIFVSDQGMFGEDVVRCTMLSAHSPALAAFQEGTEVRIKGW
jgi:hypothetical protein